MAPDKLLAEWFWTDRWTGSSAFLLPQEARGVYREMLTQAWRRGAKLPNDHDAIQRATGTTQEEWARSWPLIQRYWRVKKDSLVNPTQARIYAETIALQHTRSVSGRRGGLKTQGVNRQAKMQASVQANGEAKINPPSPSPSPSPLFRKERETRTPERPNYQNTALIGKNPHLKCFWCDPSLCYCVPPAVHHKLAELLAPKHAGDRDRAGEALVTWYPTVTATLVDGFVMGDAFRFWQGRFDAAFATVDAAVVSTRDHDADTRRDTEAVRDILRRQGVL